MKVVYSVAFGVGAFFALNCGSGEDGYPSSGAPGAAQTGAGAGAQTGATADESKAAPAPAPDPNVVEVKVVGHDFDPPGVRIKANQTVRWVWVSGRHNVVSGSGCTPDGTFSSGATGGPPSTFEHKFEKAGAFPYYCDPHCGVGMKGTITVE